MSNELISADAARKLTITLNENEEKHCNLINELIAERSSMGCTSVTYNIISDRLMGYIRSKGYEVYILRGYKHVRIRW